MTKMRWIGRELLEVVSTEFRDRSMEYYVRFLPSQKRFAQLTLFFLEIRTRIGCHNR